MVSHGKKLTILMFAAALTAGWLPARARAASKASAHTSECAEVYRQKATGEDQGGIKRWLYDHFLPNVHAGAVPADLNYLGPAAAPVTAFVDFAEFLEARHESAEERSLDKTEQMKMMSRILYQNSTGQRYDAWQDFFRDVRHDMPGFTRADLENRLENAVAKLDDPASGQVCSLKMKDNVPVFKKGKPVINVMTYFQFKRRVEGLLAQSAGSPVTIADHAPVTQQLTLPSSTGDQDSLVGFTTRGGSGEVSPQLATQNPDLTISSGPSKKQALAAQDGSQQQNSNDVSQREN